MTSETTSPEAALKIFSAICASANPLTDVRGQYFDVRGPSMLVALELSFGNESMLLTAMDDDSISVFDNQSLAEVNDHVAKQLKDTTPWKDVIGHPLLWGWVMINQQGYFDGFQLEFGHTIEWNIAPIQVMVIGSQFNIRSVKP